jgi:hypothetical protein
MSEQKKKDESIGALWISDNPKVAFSGNINMESGKVKVIVFKNSFKKEGEKSPDYKIYISKPKQEDTQSTQSTTADDQPLPF